MIGLIVPMTVGMLQMLTSLFHILHKENTWLAVLSPLYIVGLGTAVFLIVKQRLWSHVSTRKYLLITLILGFTVKLIYSMLVDVEIPEGARYLWSKSLEVAQYGFGAHLSEHQDMRVLPFYAPLLWMFGKSVFVVKVGNILALLVCSLISFDLSRSWFGERVGRGVLIATLMVPETIYSTVITTHDIPGTLYLLISLWILDRMLHRFGGKNWLSCIFLSLLLGISVTLMDVQRNILFFWLLAMVLFLFFFISDTNIWNELEKGVLYRFKRFGMLFLLLIMLPLLLQLSIFSMTKIKNFMPDSKAESQWTSNWLLGYANSWSSGRYRDASQEWMLYQEVSSKQRSSIALTTILSDIYYNPIDKGLNYLFKARRLYSLGTQVNRYYENDRLLSTSALKGKSIGQFLTTINDVFVLFFECAFVVSSIILLAKGMIPVRMWQALLVLACMSILLLLLGENQPRYMYPLWFIAPIISLAHLDMWLHSAHSVQRKTTLNEVVVFIARGFLVIAAAFCLSYSVFYVLSHFSDRLYLDMSAWTDFHSEFGPGNQDFFRKIQPGSSGQRRFRLALQFAHIPSAGERVTVEHSYVVRDMHPRTFRVYVHSPYCGPDRKCEEGAFYVSVLVNGKEAGTVPVDRVRNARLIEVNHILPDNGRIQIELAVKASLSISSQSWQEFPPVYFEYAQMYKEEGLNPWESLIVRGFQMIK